MVQRNGTTALVMARAAPVVAAMGIALSGCGDGGTVEEHTARLRSKDRKVRRDAAEKLGELRDAKGVSSLIAALDDDDLFVQTAVIRALAAIGHEDAAGPITEMLNHADWQTRRSAARAMRRFRRPETTRALVLALQADADSSVRMAAAESLGELSDKRAVPALAQSLRDPVDAVRRCSAMALGRLGDPAAVPALVDALQDEAQGARMFSARALGNLGDNRAVIPLTEALEDEDSSVRATAAKSLGQLRDKRATPTLIKALADRDRFVRDNAAWALGEIGDPRAVEALTRAAREHKGSSITNAADYALQKIQRNQ
jgi:HEAT repeat protein